MLLDRIAAAGAGRYWTHLKPALLAEAMPTHGFHVFGVYPWTRLLTAEPTPPGPARARQLPHQVGAGHLGRVATTRPSGATT